MVRNVLLDCAGQKSVRQLLGTQQKKSVLIFINLRKLTKVTLKIWESNVVEYHNIKLRSLVKTEYRKVNIKNN